MLAAVGRLAGDSPDAVVQRGDVVISGDTQLAEQFRELGRLLRPDPEEELALLVGDAAAHRLGRSCAPRCGCRAGRPVRRC